MAIAACPDPPGTGTAGGGEAAQHAGCSSPPCMLGEGDGAPVAGAEAQPGPEDAEDVRLWRKAKRMALLDQRAGMPGESRAAHSERITAALPEVIGPGAGERLVGFYWPFKREYDPRPVVRALHAQGVRLALPVVVAKAQPLVFRPWQPGVPMVLGVWNIPFPTEGDPVLPDTLLVPLLGFDRRGYRLGYGGGYYDRTVAAMSRKPLLVGVGFELNRLSTIHPQPHDIRMDVIVTERGVERFD